IRGVGEADEASGYSRNDTVQLDRVLAALLLLEGQVDGIRLSVAFDVGRLPLLQGLEVAELVEAENADVPKARVEHVAFVDEQLAADHLVAGGVVAAEVDAPHEELLALVDGKRHVDGAVL